MYKISLSHAHTVRSSILPEGEYIDDIAFLLSNPLIYNFFELCNHGLKTSIMEYQTIPADIVVLSLV